MRSSASMRPAADFSYTVQVPPDAVGGQISIRLTGLYPPPRGLDSGHPGPGGLGQSRTERGGGGRAARPGRRRVARAGRRRCASWATRRPRPGARCARCAGPRRRRCGRQVTARVRTPRCAGEDRGRERVDELRRLTQASEQEWRLTSPRRPAMAGRPPMVGRPRAGKTERRWWGQTAGGSTQTADTRPPDVGG